MRSIFLAVPCDEQRRPQANKSESMYQCLFHLVLHAKSNPRDQKRGKLTPTPWDRLVHVIFFGMTLVVDVVKNTISVDIPLDHSLACVS